MAQPRRSKRNVKQLAFKVTNLWLPQPISSQCSHTVYCIFINRDHLLYQTLTTNAVVVKECFQTAACLTFAYCIFSAALAASVTL